MPKSYYIYISSKNRSENEKINNFNVILNNPIHCNKNEGFNISVIGFSMLNTDYNLRNISFDLLWMDIANNTVLQTDIINVPDGNYSYLSLMDYLNTTLSGLIEIQYIKERNVYTFKNIDYINHDFIIRPKSISKFIGLSGDLILDDNNFHDGGYINLVNYSHIIIKSNYLDYEDNTQDNINNKQLGASNILFMIDKQDILPFQLISYRNHDKCDNYSYNISNKQISIIDLHLYNEMGEELTYVSDYFLTLKIVVNEKEIKTNTAGSLEDIKFILMSMMFGNKNKNLLL
jgi:hypothetical protein